MVQRTELFRPNEFRLVVTDLQMPELNGLGFVAAVKREYPLIPVILMTANRVAGCFALGASAVWPGSWLWFRSDRWCSSRL